jgi:hypothetical protein
MDDFFPHIKTLVNPIKVPKCIEDFDLSILRSDNPDKDKIEGEFIISTFQAFQSCNQIVGQAERLIIWKTVEKGAILEALYPIVKSCAPTVKKLSDFIEYLEKNKAVEIKEYDVKVSMRIYQFAKKYPNVLYAGVNIHTLYKHIASLEKAIKEDGDELWWGLDSDPNDWEDDFKANLKRRCDSFVDTQTKTVHEQNAKKLKPYYESQKDNIIISPQNNIYPGLQREIESPSPRRLVKTTNSQSSNRGSQPPSPRKASTATNTTDTTSTVTTSTAKFNDLMNSLSLGNQTQPGSFNPSFKTPSPKPTNNNSMEIDREGNAG